MSCGLARSLVVGAIAALQLVACGDAPTEPEPRTTFTRQFYFGSERVEVVARNYSSSGQSVTRTIGKSGGFLTVNGVMLYVPSGALDVNVDITLTVPTGANLNIQLEPHGLVFRKPAYLGFALNGTNFGLNDAEFTLDGVYHKDGAAAGLVTPREVMPIQIWNNLAAFGVWHFSDYAIVKKTKGLILVGG